MGIFKPYWMTTNIRKIEEAKIKIRKIEDQTLLEKIYKEARNSDVSLTAFYCIADEEFLFNEIMKKGNLDLSDVFLIKKISSQHYLERLIPKVRCGTDICEVLYKKLDNPPFEWTLAFNNAIAEQRLEAAVKEMRYPQDEEILRIVVEKAQTERGRNLAITKLPFDRDYIESLLHQSQSASFAKAAALIIPDDSDLLDKKVCSKCGSLESVEFYSEWIPRKDDYDEGFKCNVCGYKSGTYGDRPLEKDDDFSITLRELRKN